MPVLLQCGKPSGFFKIHSGHYDLDLVAMGITLVRPSQHITWYCVVVSKTCNAVVRVFLASNSASYFTQSCELGENLKHMYVAWLQLITALVAYGTRESATFNFSRALLIALCFAHVQPC